MNTPICIEDYFHNIPLLAEVNYWINNDEFVGKTFLIITQLIMDFACLSLSVYWMLYVKNLRFPITVGLFYFLRLFFVHGF